VYPIFARDVEILVEDTELGLPLEGAVIRSWDGKQYTCDENGKAMVSVPDDRQVVVQAAYPGYESGRLVIAQGGSAYKLGLRLSGIMEGRELVIEAARPGTSETRTGRSVAISGRDIAQTAEIGIIEDVMSSIKLLPGVGYAGSFNAQPSIRGGDPWDMNASLDGFYILNPYHWGGGFSIFDPRMVQSAQLSHGVFSSRYGHTISGLLDITSKKPSPTETEFELGLNTSAANFNLSLPFAGRGGILFMGRLTYYDPIVWLAKQAAKVFDALELINMIRVAPYIRSGTITGNYRFSDNLELNFTGFWGMDGAGASYENFTYNANQTSRTDLKFDWTNYQGFFTTGLSWNPRNDMLLKLTAGVGYERAVLDADITNRIREKSISENAWYDLLDGKVSPDKLKPSYDLDSNIIAKDTEKMFNVQGRIDYDWELGKGFLVATGVQEMFTSNFMSGNQHIPLDTWLINLDPSEQEEILKDIMGDIDNPMIEALLLEKMRISSSKSINPNAGNRMFTTSGYGLVEYNSPNNRFGAELGLRVDHFHLIGKDGFSIQTKPALNPRLNIDFNVFKNRGFVQSFDISVGTGLFSSINSAVVFAEEKYNITEMKPNRSWTSVAGTRLELGSGFIVNIEGYYKYIFDRTYVPVDFNNIKEFVVEPQFNGIGRVWGIDLLLQKLQSRYFDGWLSYSFNWARYLDPDGGFSNLGLSGGNRGDDWYFPSYHRFHNLNLVLNIRPRPNINFYTRLGIASGLQLPRRIGDRPISYPVYMYEGFGSSANKFIEKYIWPSVNDENNRSTVSLPMDIKFSLFGKNSTGKVRFEVYVALENVLALLYTAKGNTSFNEYTGEVNTGSDAAAYEIPIPRPSFGFKISY
jgi:hypothetical protein